MMEASTAEGDTDTEGQRWNRGAEVVEGIERQRKIVEDRGADKVEDG